MTSIPYNLGIPNAPDNPSTDQPNMKLNNDNIATYVAVDHVGFNAGSGATSGHHLQVTFDSNNVPSVPTSPPVLFTNTVSGLPQLFFYSGSSAKGSTQYYIASAGGGAGQVESSTFLLGGLVLKTGSVTISGGPSPVNFVVAFPNSCLSVIAQPINSTGPTSANDYVYVSGSPTASSFNATATRRITTASNTVNFFYIAIGY
jgi:hypothetical protein